MSSDTVHPLDSRTDRLHGFRPPDSFSHVSEEPVMPLVISEISQAVTVYPLGIAEYPRTHWHLVAVVGLYAKQNLFVDHEGRWRGAYLPGVLRSYPFNLRPARSHADAQDERLVFCFNKSGGLYREAPDRSQGEQRFFDDTGKLEPVVQKCFDYLLARHRDEQITKSALRALHEAGLFVPWQVSPVSENGDKQVLKGIYRIDESALNNLGADELLTLRNANALPVAYAQLFSMSRIGVLKHLSELKTRQTPPPRPLDRNVVDRMFGEDEDTLPFSL